jgi:CheY-like chemotaxis protein
MNRSAQVHNKTILVVDDDPATCELIQDILESCHYHVVTAHDGLEAVERTNHGHIDLILMDIMMPYLSGMWFCKAFKEKKNTSNIPIVIVSAGMDAESDERARRMGACATVKKPFHCEELVRIVEENAL